MSLENHSNRSHDKPNPLVTDKLSGTNLERAADHNQRVVLQAIRMGDPITRGQLVEQTGLTQPTILNITRRLIKRGYVLEKERDALVKGSRAPTLHINPSGCYSLGVNIDRDHATLVLLDLAGKVHGRAVLELTLPEPKTVLDFVIDQTERILREHKIGRDLVIGMGLAVPGGLDSITLPGVANAVIAWQDVDIKALFQSHHAWPIFVENDAAAAAIGEAEFGRGLKLSSFFYLLLTAGLGGGLVIDGTYSPGASERAGRIGFLEMPDGAQLQSVASLSALMARVRSAGGAVRVPQDLAVADPVSDPIVTAWIDDAAAALAAPLDWVSCMIDPEAILIGGRLPIVLIERLARTLNERLSPRSNEFRSMAPIHVAHLAEDAPAIGAAILPFKAMILPSGAVLRNTAYR